VVGVGGVRQVERNRALADGGDEVVPGAAEFFGPRAGDAAFEGDGDRLRVGLN